MEPTKPNYPQINGRRLSLNDFPPDVQRTVYALLAKAAARKAQREAEEKRPTA